MVRGEYSRSGESGAGGPESQSAHIGPVSLMIATPVYTGQIAVGFVNSLLDLQYSLRDIGCGFEFSTLENISILPLARNLLAERFLASSCTHILFIDSDIEFRTIDVLKMLEYRHLPVIAGIYPRKAIDWETLAVVDVDPGVEKADVLRQLSGSFRGMFRFKETIAQIDDLENPIEVSEITTGLMMIARSTFLALIESGIPVAKTRFGKGPCEAARTLNIFFDNEIDTNGNYVGEDFTFCRRVIESGGKVFMCPWFVTSHIGQFIYIGNLQAAIDGGVGLR